MSNPAARTNPIAAVLEVLVAAIREAGPDGVPGGHLYACLMTYGCSYSTFEALMAALVREGKVRKRGQVYLALNA